MGSPALAVTPQHALQDVPRRITATGFGPGENVWLLASSMQPDGRRWHSAARFVADAEGRVGTADQAPVEGSYAGISAMGPVWSMVPDEAAAPVEVSPVAPVTVRLRMAGASGRAEAEFTQALMARGVTRQHLRADGLVGTFYLPEGDGPFPAVMVLNGSDGGINHRRGALFASHGFATLALGYFRVPGRSDYISNTPLEYFAAGLDWMRNTLHPPGDFVAVCGQSRGGELALLLGATFPERIRAVVGYVPGAVVHSGQNAADPRVGRNGPTWTLGGEPLAHVWEGNRTATWAPFDEGPEPHRHEWAVSTALDDADAVARARIPVERIRGPVMLISGTDDGSWPSTRYCRMVEESLSAARHPWPVQHLCYEGAGHSINPPYVPTTQVVYRHWVSGRVNTGGGTPALNAAAGEASWPRVLEFLRTAAA
jgi:fermentation-respiration switch protein FrsA (DUF1100 family)